MNPVDEAEIYAATELFAKSHNKKSAWEQRDRSDLVETVMKAFGYSLNHKGEYIRGNETEEERL